MTRSVPGRPLLLFLCFALGACPPASRESASSPSRVLLITLDTARADHFSAYGYDRATTPRVDALARQGVLFERAYSQSSSTLPSTASLMTSRYPHQHGVLDTFGYSLGDAEVTMAERLGDSGLTTAAFIGIGTLASNRGLRQGFDEYSAPAYVFGKFWIRAGQISTDAIDWLDSHHDTPFFLWVHYFEPHPPHDGVPEAYLQRFEREPSRHAVLSHSGLDREEYARLKQRVDRYDGALSYADAQIGRLLDKVEALGLDDDTLVVLTADHGECLGEHGLNGHRYELFEPVIRVPLIIRAPGLSPGRESELVGHVDILPTILSRLGIASGDGLEGRSLLRGGSSSEADEAVVRTPRIFAETTTPRGHRSTVISGQWKLMVSRSADDDETTALYHLASDPSEAIDRLGDAPLTGMALRRLLAEWRRRPTIRAASESTVQGPEVEMLRSLGYVD